jgi:hypothetical protein
VADTVHRFHTFKEVFLLGRAGKMGKAKAYALKRKLGKKLKVDEETNADTCKESQKWREMNAWREYISHEIDDAKELDADFNFPKILLTSHLVGHLHRYGALQGYSSARNEQG